MLRLVRLARGHDTHCSSRQLFFFGGGVSNSALQRPPRDSILRGSEEAQVLVQTLYCVRTVQMLLPCLSGRIPKMVCYLETFWKSQQ